VLFPVDRTNLGEQAEKEFQAYRAPGVDRKFTELYNVQRLASNSIMDSSRVVIATIQRVYNRPRALGRVRATCRCGIAARGVSLSHRLQRPSRFA
jgi:type I site-specific restriction endonuclease